MGPAGGALTSPKFGELTWWIDRDRDTGPGTLPLIRKVWLRDCKVKHANNSIRRGRMGSSPKSAYL